MKRAQLAVATSLIVLPLGAFAQTIQRCEGANQRITYSNAECPSGTKSVKALPKAPQPTAEARAAAQAKLQRDKEQVKVQQAQRQQRPAGPNAHQAALQQAADCGYLQAAIESSRQLRSVLTTRPYYSTEDVDAADAKTAELVAEYRRVCG
jgi:hypothetical protein